MQLIRLLYVKMEVTVIETNKGHKCEGFRYRLDVETKSGDLSWRCSAKGCKTRVRTYAGPTLVPLSRADKEKEQNLIDLHINM